MYQTDFFNLHSHSEFSCLDGVGKVEDMVAKAATMGQPALGLSDHGTMAGCLRLYKECAKYDLAAFCGEEFYLVKSALDPVTRTQRYHLGLYALDQRGFKALVGLSSRSHQRERFHRKPLIDLSDLAALHEAGDSKHVALLTGCFYGLVTQKLVTEGVRAAKRVVEYFAKLFPHTLVEVQNHLIRHDNGTQDWELTDQMVGIAKSLGLPCIATQDSHYLNHDHQHAHDLMKDICYFGDGEDNRFPGDGFHLSDDAWVRKHFDAKTWKNYIEDGYGYLLDRHRLKLPALDKYKFHVPFVVEQPQRRVDRLCRKNLLETRQYVTWNRYGTRTEYVDRLNYELEVIDKMAMADYFLLVKEVTDWCRKHDVVVNARGSVNGSLVCFVLGITNVDPLQWHTSFDRFLSLDRKKPPDIDLDVESTSRTLVVEHLRSKFPTMVQLGTYLRIGFTEQQDDDVQDSEDHGSVVVQYMAAKRRKDKSFDGHIADEDRGPLNDLCQLDVRKSPGAHAAGFVLPGEGLEISDYLATQLIPSSGLTVTQAVMEDVEEAGYVKLDILGVRSLRTIRMALEQTGLKLEDIPWDDAEACKSLRSGHGDGIFQFDGYSTMKGGKQMGVKNTQDAILCLALYRPALMAGGQTERYLANRKAPKAAERLPGLFDGILQDTCWVPVFQEQVMEMCRAIDMAYEDWNDLMKAVKASNDKIGAYAVDTFRRLWPVFLDLCQAKGMTSDEAQQTWDAIRGFTDYGFNRAHATSYGIMAYRAAYLKAHHPLEYMNGLLDTWAGTTKERLYLREARRLGISIGRPDVSISDISWTVDPTKPDTLRKGLLSIKGVGYQAAETIVAMRQAQWGDSGAWDSMDDFVDDMPPRPVSGGKSWKKDGTLVGVMRTLRDAGALKSLGVDA